MASQQEADQALPSSSLLKNLGNLSFLCLGGPSIKVSGDVFASLRQFCFA